MLACAVQRIECLGRMTYKNSVVVVKAQKLDEADGRKTSVTSSRRASCIHSSVAAKTAISLKQDRTKVTIDDQ